MNFKTITQDILNVILTFALVGMGLSSKLQPLLSPVTYNWVMLVLAGALLLVYNADVIFGFPNTNVPTTTTPISPPSVPPAA